MIFRSHPSAFRSLLTGWLTISANFLYASANDTQLPLSSTATYAAEYNGHRVTAKRTYQPQGKGWSLRFEAESWFASVVEQSRFSWNANGQVISDQYFYKREVLGRDRVNSATFDHDTGWVDSRREDRSYRLPLKQSLLDKQNYQIQLRHDLINNISPLVYDVLDGKRIKQYRFRRLGNETISTPLGPLETVKVERVREDSERETRLWFATQWNHMVVKLVQIDEDDQRFQIDVIQFSVGGKSPPPR